jgi:hypothetical protein
MQYEMAFCFCDASTFDVDRMFTGSSSTLDDGKTNKMTTLEVVVVYTTRSTTNHEPAKIETRYEKKRPAALHSSSFSSSSETLYISRKTMVQSGRHDRVSIKYTKSNNTKRNTTMMEQKG